MALSFIHEEYMSSHLFEGCHERWIVIDEEDVSWFYLYPGECCLEGFRGWLVPIPAITDIDDMFELVTYP